MDCIHYYCIAVAALALFLWSFFPLQQIQNETVELPVLLNDVQLDTNQLYRPEIKRLIVVVIDALRLDFINETNMPFLVSTYQSEGCMMDVHVQSPTVTLPRIKALTTGGIPQYIDIVFNLASSEILTDSILHKAKQIGKKIVFYGDDTWIKLYPTMFERFEGVHSFYVSDYTEVDNNVTRNVIMELHNEDWDMLILHYLGLDHIGHVFGPFSDLVRPKLNEMDDVIKKIWQTSRKWKDKTLIVVTGDHGMKDSGGHGGATYNELHVPFVPIGIPCKDAFVEQTDIPVNLASLWGLLYPAISIGCINSNLFTSFATDRLLYILHYNAWFLLSKLKQYEDLFKQASALYYKYLKTNNDSIAMEAQKSYEDCSRRIRDELVHSFVIQNSGIMVLAISIIFNCLCAVFYNFFSSLCNSKSRLIEKLFMLVFILTHNIAAHYFLLLVIYVSILGWFIIRNLIGISEIFQWKFTFDNIHLFAVVGTIVQSFCLLSSSFIEEEHQVWYFLFGTLLLLNWYFKLTKCASNIWLVAFIGLRLLRTINQTGDKWAHLPDTKRWLLLKENKYFLQFFSFCSLLLILFCCYHLLHRWKKSFFFSTFMLSLICVFHMWTIQSTIFVRFIGFLMVSFVIFGLTNKSKCLDHITVTWLLYCSLLMRQYNMVLLSFCIFISELLCGCLKNSITLTTSHIWLGWTLFFCQGHSNSLASIDVASGYLGLREYVPLIVVIQVICHTYTFPILINLLLLRHNLLQANAIFTINIISRLSLVSLICIVILIQQHHLFVWTVFAPKLLIESCHSGMLFVELLLFTVLHYFLK